MSDSRQPPAQLEWSDGQRKVTFGIECTPTNPSPLEVTAFDGDDDDGISDNETACLASKGVTFKASLEKCSWTENERYWLGWIQTVVPGETKLYYAMADARSGALVYTLDGAMRDGDQQFVWYVDDSEGRTRAGPGATVYIIDEPK